jgi:shikimate dehydrogenase
LARFAHETGRVLVAGLDLLVHQAVLQVELMTGLPDGPLEAMRAAGERALEKRGANR